MNKTVEVRISGSSDYFLIDIPGKEYPARISLEKSLGKSLSDLEFAVRLVDLYECLKPITSIHIELVSFWKNITNNFVKHIKGDQDNEQQKEKAPLG